MCKAWLDKPEVRDAQNRQGPPILVVNEIMNKKRNDKGNFRL